MSFSKQFSSGHHRVNIIQKMGPKRTNNKVENKQHQKCPYYDRGYCQHKDKCNLKHSEEVCDDSD